MTESAITRVHELLEADTDAKGKALRLFVQGGGCAGFEYGFRFDDKNDDDQVITQEGFDVLLDPMSSMYLMGMQVDYSEGLSGAGFQFNNPNASGSCGCGKSFSV